MKVRDLVIETGSALDANRGRSALTVLGIVIGIAAVIAMTALIGGINRALVGELGLSQAQLINIYVYPENRQLTYEDVDKMARDLTDYEFVVATTYGYGDVTTGEKKASASIQGVKPLYFKAQASKFVQGHTFTDADEGKGSLVAVLDKNSVRVLFGSADAEVVGKTITVNNNQYSIVGVIEDQNGFGGDSVNMFVPFSTCSARITGSSSIDSIMGFAREGTDIDSLVKKTEDYLVKTFDISDENRDGSVYVSSMQSMIDSMNATMSSFSLLMTVVAGVSLLVGGIGIMNMMLTNVTERIREIGLRKALGARRSDITKQFMLESVCLCVIGGLLGIIVGYLGAFLLTGIGASAFMGEGTTMQVTPYVDAGTVLMATGICVFIGVLFGWYPARRAARLDPVESLHYQ